MTMDRFEELIHELSRLIQVPLHLDEKRLCRLKVDHAFSIQLELDPSQEKILLSCFLSDIQAGKFREEVLKEALKANTPHSPELLAYSDRNNHLVLFRYFPLSLITPEELSQALPPFLAKADAWRLALEKGLTTPYSATSFLFDLQP